MDETKPKPFVFVLMPFNTEFDDVYLGIKAACNDAGAYCERVDEQTFITENILERIYNQIGKADIIVAEMTGRNSNVFYETGYAHALNKQVILLTQRAEDIPFDLKLFPHIVYEGKLTKLKTALEERVRWCIEHPQDSLSKVEMNLKFFMNRVALEKNVTVSAKLGHFSKEKFVPNRFILELSIHNPTNKVVNPKHFSIALIVPENRMVVADSSPIRSSAGWQDGRRIYSLKQTNAFFPDGWDSIKVHMNLIGRDYETPINMTLRVFTLFGPVDYTISLTLTKPPGDTATQ